jgi:hypothetical protein
MGDGTDTCPQEGKSWGCPCTPGVADCEIATNAACCQEDNVCRDIPSSALFYATPSSGLTVWREGNVQYAEYRFDDNGIIGFRRPIAFNKITEMKVHLSDSHFGPYALELFTGYNYTGWNKIWDADCAIIIPPICCTLGCNPMSFGTYTSSTGPICMDSFLVGFGVLNLPGSPDIIGIECKFSLS